MCQNYFGEKLLASVSNSSEVRLFHIVCKRRDYLQICLILPKKERESIFASVSDLFFEDRLCIVGKCVHFFPPRSKIVCTVCKRGDYIFCLFAPVCPVLLERDCAVCKYVQFFRSVTVGIVFSNVSISSRQRLLA